MRPGKPTQQTPTSPPPPRQGVFDNTFAALRDDHERAERAWRRIQQRAGGSHPPMPHQDEVHMPPADVSPKSAPPSRLPAFETHFGPTIGGHLPTQPRPINPSDPSRFQLSPIRETPISAPLMPHLYDMRVHVEQDPSQQYQTFEFDMQFKIRMAPGLPGKQQAPQ